ncbi:MAG: hypothetical protein OXC19_09640, partial [Bryobacterales bacterium]|nr:hypothetical protein [Bryobacterales bacterium]
AREKPTQVVQAGMSLQIEMQDHPPMIPTPPGEPPSGSFLVGINPSLQAHLSLEKAKRSHTPPV